MNLRNEGNMATWQHLMYHPGTYGNKSGVIKVGELQELRLVANEARTTH